MRKMSRLLLIVGFLAIALGIVDEAWADKEPKRLYQYVSWMKQYYLRDSSPSNLVRLRTVVASMARCVDRHPAHLSWVSTATVK